MSAELKLCNFSDNDLKIGSKPLLLCLSHLRWDFVFQRPQHILTRAAVDYDVIVIEEPVYEAHRQPDLQVTGRAGGIRVAVPVLEHGISEAEAELVQQALIDSLLATIRPAELILWYYTPMALAFTRHLDPDVIVYDNMDELSAFAGASPRLIRLEEEIMDKADLVFTGGMSLFEAKRSRHPAITAFPSSIDKQHFAAARTGLFPDPVDQAAIPHPRVGFFGVIDERFDIDLLGQVAAKRPDISFVMLGPVVKIDPGRLPQASNIHWLGSKAYRDLPAYLGHWDAGLMPFAHNESTRFISPTKTPEFLAAGVPVVSTSIRDVVRPYGEKGLVEIADDAQAMSAALDKLLAGPAPGWRKAVDAHLANLSWDKTVKDMMAMVDELRSSATPPAKASLSNAAQPVAKSLLAGASHV